MRILFLALAALVAVPASAIVLPAAAEAQSRRDYRDYRGDVRDAQRDYRREIRRADGPRDLRDARRDYYRDVRGARRDLRRDGWRGGRGYYHAPRYGYRR